MRELSHNLKMPSPAPKNLTRDRRLLEEEAGSGQGIIFEEVGGAGLLDNAARRFSSTVRTNYFGVAVRSPHRESAIQFALHRGETSCPRALTTFSSIITDPKSFAPYFNAI